MTLPVLALALGLGRRVALLLELLELAHLLRRRLLVRHRVRPRRRLFLRRRRLFLRCRREGERDRRDEGKRSQSSSSMRRRTMLPVTVSSRSMRAVAWSTFFS